MTRTPWTEAHIQDLLKADKIVAYKVMGRKDRDKPAKGSKYGNKRVEWQGEWFDSKRELARYKELLLMLKAGEIGLLERQIAYELNTGGEFSYKYIADFTYWDNRTGLFIVEDCKGALTTVYKKKRRLMKKIYGITILET